MPNMFGCGGIQQLLKFKRIRTFAINAIFRNFELHFTWFFLRPHAIEKYKSAIANL